GAARLADLPPGALQQSHRTPEDHHPRLCDRRAGASLCVQPDLVGQHQYVRDDERLAGRLFDPRRRRGPGHASLGTGLAAARIRSGALMTNDRARFGPHVGIDLPGARERTSWALNRDLAGVLLAILTVVVIVLALALLSGTDTGLVGALIKWTPFMA